jgi:hypothetical protein
MTRFTSEIALSWTFHHTMTPCRSTCAHNQPSQHMGKITECMIVHLPNFFCCPGMSPNTRYKHLACQR